ncbi:hypothetical protein SAMN04488499_10544, partial [Sporomusa acidovorans]
QESMQDMDLQESIDLQESMQDIEFLRPI